MNVVIIKLILVYLLLGYLIHWCWNASRVNLKLFYERLEILLLVCHFWDNLCSITIVTLFFFYNSHGWNSHNLFIFISLSLHWRAIRWRDPSSKHVGVSSWVIYRTWLVSTRCNLVLDNNVLWWRYVLWICLFMIFK